MDLTSGRRAEDGAAVGEVPGGVRSAGESDGGARPEAVSGGSRAILPVAEPAYVPLSWLPASRGQAALGALVAVLVVLGCCLAAIVA